jgi:hypothetical protein
MLVPSTLRVQTMPIRRGVSDPLPPFRDRYGQRDESRSSGYRKHAPKGGIYADWGTSQYSRM